MKSYFPSKHHRVTHNGSDSCGCRCYHTKRCTVGGVGFTLDSTDFTDQSKSPARMARREPRPLVPVNDWCHPTLDLPTLIKSLK